MTQKQSSRSVARGAVWLFAVQAGVGLGQLVYAGITSRIFRPAEFGAFAAALGLYGIFVLIASTGPASFILRERMMHIGTRRRILVMNIVSSCFTSVAFVVLLPVWAIFLSSPRGVEFGWLLCAALFISPFTATESAFLRREGRAAIDGMVLLGSFIVSSVVGVVFVFSTQELWALAAATCANPIIGLIACRLLQKSRIESGQGVPFRSILRYSTNVLGQNSIFFLLQQAPVWFVGAVSGPSALGSFSRASTLTLLPATSMATAVNRVLQPTYRNFTSYALRSSAVTDSAVIAAALAFPLFATLAAIGPQIVRLWLGPGWELAGELVWLLAIGFAFQVPYTVLAGDLELQSRFAPARWSQVGMLISLGLGMAWFASTEDLYWAAIAVLASQFVGLVALCLLAPSGGAGLKKRLYLGLGVQLGLAAVLHGFVRLVVFGAERLMEESGELGSFLEAGIACASGLIFILLTLRVNPAMRILRSRGVVSRRTS